MRNSLKQLLHTPVKAALFFLLMAAACLLLIFGSVMLVQSLQRIDAAEEQFSTVGFVSQPPSVVTDKSIPYFMGFGGDVPNTCKTRTERIREYDELLSPELLKCEKAEYLLEPEQRPYYITSLPQYHGTNNRMDGKFSTYVIEFSPVKDSTVSSFTEVRVKRILMNKETEYDESRRNMMGIKERLEIGDVIRLYDNFTGSVPALKSDKTYVCMLAWDGIYMIYHPPYSTQCGAADGMYLSPEAVRKGKKSTSVESRILGCVLSTPSCPRVDEVTENFYGEGNRGQDWLTWIEMHEKYDSWFWVLPTNGLDLLPAFHGRKMSVCQGREITAEEFETGKAVCMISYSFALENHLELGDKIRLPLYFALYGYLPDRDHTYPELAVGFPTYGRGYSPLDADMKPYEPFWEAEYEIVGTYEPLSPNTLLCGTTEIARDMFIIPMKSVKASDENNIAHYGPMNALTTSFQIPNGTIQEFDAALRKAVPEVSQLNITYDDNGYEEVMGSLRSARLTAVLLFLVGLVSTVAIVILLLFFFIVKQKKRTAIERSLGMSKKQCRVSLIAGILVLTIAAAMVGSLGGALLLNSMDSNADITETTEFDTSYSLWAQNRPMEVELDESDAAVTAALYIAIPIILTLFVFLLSLSFVNQNLKVEPLLLLSTKTE